MPEYLSFILIVTLVSVISIGGGKALAEKINNSVTVGTTKKAYYDDLIGNYEEDESKRNWHPTDDGGAIWYDEGGIAHDLKELNSSDPYGYEFDVGVASLLERIGTEKTDTVLRYTDYGSLDEYLSDKGFEDTKAFQENIDKQIIIKTELDEKQKELNEMRNETDNEIAQSSETAKAGER